MYEFLLIGITITDNITARIVRVRVYITDRNARSKDSSSTATRIRHTMTGRFIF